MTKSRIPWPTIVGALLLAATSLPAQGVGSPVPADPAFDPYVNLDLLASAWQDKDAELLTDLALQLSEGERILLRHRKGIHADQIFSVAIKTAAEHKDAPTLDRLASVLGELKKKDLASQVTAVRRLVADSRAIDPSLSVQPDAGSPAAFFVLQANLEEIASAKLAGDRDAVQNILKEISELTQLSEAQRRALTKVGSDALEAMPAERDAATASLNKLLGESRAVRSGGGGGGGGRPASTSGGGGRPMGPSTSGGSGRPSMPSSNSSGSRPMGPSTNGGTGRPSMPSSNSSGGRPMGPSTNGGSGRPSMPSNSNSGGRPSGPSTNGGTGRPSGPSGNNNGRPSGGNNGGRPSGPSNSNANKNTHDTHNTHKNGNRPSNSNTNHHPNSHHPGWHPRPNPFVINNYVRRNFVDVIYVPSVYGYTIGGGRQVFISEYCQLDPGDVIISVGRIHCNNTRLTLEQLIDQANEDGETTMVVRDVNTGENVEIDIGAPSGDGD